MLAAAGDSPSTIAAWSRNLHIYGYVLYVRK